MFSEKSHLPSTLPGTWVPNVMHSTAATSMMPQGYLPSNGYYTPQYYQQQSNPGYDGYGMLPGAHPYQQIPGVYGMTASPTSIAYGYGTPSTPNADSPSNASDSLKTSPIESKVTGVLTKNTGGRIRKKPLETGKPPYSYISLICMAIAAAPDKKSTLREICDYIAERFPYYQNKTNWHGNIRHNLTLNDCFVKMPRRAGDKGHPWAIDPSFEDMFDGGSLLRRRYRYKKGSAKWNKSQAKAAARLSTASPKKRGRKPKEEMPKNAMVMPQPDGTSKVVPLSPPAYPAQPEESVDVSEIRTDAAHLNAEVVPQPDGTTKVVTKSSPGGTNNHPHDTHSYNSSLFDLSSQGTKINEHSSHNSAESSFIDVTSPGPRMVSLESSMSGNSSALHAGAQLHELRSPNDQRQPSSYQVPEVLSSTFHSSGSQHSTHQHGSSLTHQSPQGNQGSPNSAASTYLSPSSLQQSPEFHSPPSHYSANNTGTPYQPSFHYRGYASCYPMASSTPTPACSYPMPLGNAYLPSPCSSGSQLYQGLQSEYYNLLSSPKLQ